MNEILINRSPESLATANEANQFRFLQLNRSIAGVEAYDGPYIQQIVTDIPFAWFNNVSRAQIEATQLDITIEAAIARCEARQVPMLWLNGPHSRPADLGDHLSAHGFHLLAETEAMAADLLALNEELEPVPGLEIEQVDTLGTLELFCQILAAGFGMSKDIERAWQEMIFQVGLNGKGAPRLYLGRQNGEPVATSALILAAGVAGIYCVATVPEERRRGLGTALTLAPLRDARALGYRFSTLQASKMGISVYRRLGFWKQFKIGMYAWSPENAASGKSQ